MEERIDKFKVSSFNSGYNRKIGFNSGYNKKIEHELQVNEDADATDSANIIACYSQMIHRTKNKQFIDKSLKESFDLLDIEKEL